MAEKFWPLLKEEDFYFSVDELITFQKQKIMLENYFKKVSAGTNITPFQAICNLRNILFYNRFKLSLAF